MPTPSELAEYIYVWGMAAAVIAVPTGLVLMWLMCREPSAPVPSHTAAATDPVPAQ